MDHNFSEIVLLKNELKILKKLKRGNIKFEDESVLAALKCYKFIEPTSLGVDENFNPIFDGTYKIKKKGERYLIYLKRVSTNKFWEWLRYIITTLVALAALVISIATMHT